MTKEASWTVGDLFWVPQKDQGESLGQVVSIEKKALNSVICAFYNQRISKMSGDQHVPKSDKLISILFTTPDLLDAGTWRVAGRSSPTGLDRMENYEKLKAANFVGAKVIGSGIIMKFLNAYYGLHPWDGWHDPCYLDKLLVSPGMKPNGLVYRNNTGS